MRLQLGVICILLFNGFKAQAQAVLRGTVNDGKAEVKGATVTTMTGSTITDSTGRFQLSLAAGQHSVTISHAGFVSFTQTLNVPDTGIILRVQLMRDEQSLDAVVVTGTMRAVQRLQSPIPVEVYHPQFFKKNPTASLFEGLQNINGVRPQVNCSVCNTGDIHINGLEGPYTMVTIDGMPIVSALSTVYGLFGIPTELIERVEVVKGPASALYGSEAVGGLINIITKDAQKAARFSANLMTTSWQEHNADLGIKWGGNKISVLTGINYFAYNHPVDKNGDNFTDVTLQNRISVFNKLAFRRAHNRTASLAARYFYEDRWGGEMQWQPQFRGGDSVYGESIYTRRWELLGNYSLPISEPVQLSFSATGHNQNSFYGNTSYQATQNIFFAQAVWNKNLGQHQLLSGLTARYTYYNDNTPATFNDALKKDMGERVLLPGAFLQNEWTPAPRHTLLVGLRYDHHPVHKGIVTPRFAYKFAPDATTAIRLNAGTGFRVVNLFTEDHAALTGARTVVISEALQPERSMNGNVNLSKRFGTSATQILLEASAWYTYFSNRIIPNYDADPDKIIYANLDGHSVSRGVSFNVEGTIRHRLKGNIGFTLQDVFIMEEGTRTRPVLTENWSGTWNLSYGMPALGLRTDYTGNLYGPMRLPLLSETDPRLGTSPVWSVQNIQLTKTFRRGVELYGGVKNLLNWTPFRNNPFLIARAHDPFDKFVAFNPDGSVQAVTDPAAGKAFNPYGLTFDPTYIYAPNQGRRAFIGVRYSLK